MSAGPRDVDRDSETVLAEEGRDVTASGGPPDRLAATVTKRTEGTT